MYKKLTIWIKKHVGALVIAAFAIAILATIISKLPIKQTIKQNAVVIKTGYKIQLFWKHGSASKMIDNYHQDNSWLAPKQTNTIKVLPKMQLDYPLSRQAHVGSLDKLYSEQPMAINGGNNLYHVNIKYAYKRVLRKNAKHYYLQVNDQLLNQLTEGKKVTHNITKYVYVKVPINQKTLFKASPDVPTLDEYDMYDTYKDDDDDSTIDDYYRYAPLSARLTYDCINKVHSLSYIKKHGQYYLANSVYYMAHIQNSPYYEPFNPAYENDDTSPYKYGYEVNHDDYVTPSYQDNSVEAKILYPKMPLSRDDYTQSQDYISYPEAHVNKN